jgi:histidine ammonia-lyase
VAQNLSKILSSSQLLKDRQEFQSRFSRHRGINEISEMVQEVYSLRCIPQILGPVFDSVNQSWREVQIEINSITDNPIVDWKSRQFLHGGNFHGDYIATSMDQLKQSLARLTMLSERRINFFLNNKINNFFPPFLNLEKPGLSLGLQGLQFVATSTTAESQSLAFPHRLHSIPTNADNQDIVSMGTKSARYARKVIENAYSVLAVELVTLAQAADFLEENEKLSNHSRKLYGQIRSIFPKIEADRDITEQLPRLVEAIKHSFDIEINWRSDSRN